MLSGSGRGAETGKTGDHFFNNPEQRTGQERAVLNVALVEVGCMRWDQSDPKQLKMRIGPVT